MKKSVLVLIIGLGVLIVLIAAFAIFARLNMGAVARRRRHLMRSPAPATRAARRRSRSACAEKHEMYISCFSRVSVAGKPIIGGLPSMAQIAHQQRQLCRHPSRRILAILARRRSQSTGGRA